MGDFGLVRMTIVAICEHAQLHDPFSQLPALLAGLSLAPNTQKLSASSMVTSSARPNTARAVAST